MYYVLAPVDASFGEIASYATREEAVAACPADGRVEYRNGPVSILIWPVPA
jgi:hypothetical protein